MLVVRLSTQVPRYRAAPWPGEAVLAICRPGLELVAARHKCQPVLAWHRSGWDCVTRGPVTGAYCGGSGNSTCQPGVYPLQLNSRVSPSALA